MPCRTDPNWPANSPGLQRFTCPHGVTEKNAARVVAWYAFKRNKLKWLYKATSHLKPGNVVYYLANVTGIAKLVAWLEQETGRSCGCEQRRDKWNKLGWIGCIKAALNKLNPAL